MPVALTNRGPELSEDALAGVERRLRIELPADYRAFLLDSNGGEPYPAEFVCEGDEADQRLRVTRFLSVGLRKGGAYDPDVDPYDFESTVEFQRTELELPLHLVPIAFVWDDDFLLLSVDGPDRGTVYFWYLIESGFDGSHFGRAFGSFAELLDNLEDFSPPWVRMIRTGDVAGVRAWLDEGGDVTAKDESNGFEPLTYAIHFHQLEIVRLLLESKAPTRGMLRAAGRHGTREIVTLLKKHGARRWWW